MSNNKHIVFFKTSISSGGAEHQMVLLADLLISKGYFVSIVTFADVEDHYRVNPSVERIRIAPNRSVFIKYLCILKALWTINMDVLIGFGVRESFIMLIPMLFRKRVLVISGERNTTYGRPPFYEKLDHSLLYRRADFIVTNSYTQRRYLIANYPQWESKVKTIINYTDPFSYRVQPSPGQPVVKVGIFARYSYQKNYVGIAEALYELKKRVGSVFHVSWYGNVRAHNEISHDYKIFKGLVQKYNIEDVLSLNDHVNVVADYYPLFDVLCLPSLFEGFSNSIAEYICSGKPVLASNVSDNDVMVHDNENGFLFNPRDTDSICNAFERMLNKSPEERDLMGKKSRIIAEKLFDKEAFIDAYLELIDS